MFRRYFRSFFIFSVLTAGAAGVSFLAVQRTTSAQGRVAFTASALHSVYKRSGEVVLTDELVLATRSDGSTARVRRVAAPGNRGVAAQKTIVDLAHAEKVYTDGLTDSRTSYPVPKVGVEQLSRKPFTCASDASAARDRMLGYEVVRVVQDLQSGGDMLVRREEWRAAALDCFPLKSTTFRGRTEADMYTSSITEVSQVTVGEPAPSLFETPAAYVERSPSQRRQEFNARYPETAAQVCHSCLQTGDQRADEVYFRSQSDRGK